MKAVTRILLYPVKSLDPLEVANARVLPSGALEHDRTYALFDAEGQYVNGKRYAAVHRLRSHFDIADQVLVLRSDGGPESGGQAFHVGQDHAALEDWFSDYFGFATTFRRDADCGFPDDMSSPGPTVISTATLARVGDWFGLSIEETRARFRTNIEIDGFGPFGEDSLFAAAGVLARFRIGNSEFVGVNPCQRCVVPLRDQQSGLPDPTFVRRFTELREKTLPPWSTRGRFNHFYRLAVNTRVADWSPSCRVCLGDELTMPDAQRLQTSSASGLLRGPADFWAGCLEILETRDETPTVRTFRLGYPDARELPFQFGAGQFLTVTLDSPAGRLERCYTIASSPTQRHYCEITVRREGAASTFLHENLRPGRQLKISGPTGRFTFDHTHETEIVMIAGGVGVTPLMSKLRSLVAQRWAGRIDFIYSARTSDELIFKGELVALAAAESNLNLHMTVTSKDASWSGPSGRLSKDMLLAVVPDIANRNIHMCGPTAMAGELKRLLRELGVLEARIAIEAFGGSKSAPNVGGEGAEVIFVRSDIRTYVASGACILDAALAAGVTLDHGCRAGACGRCRARVTSGQAATDCDFILTADEKTSGWILTCQSHPLTSVSLDI